MRSEFVETTKKSKPVSAQFPDMDNTQYAQWAALLEKRTGMRLPEKRRSFLVTNVSMRMREKGFTDFQDYFNHINDGSEGRVEWDRLVHRLTVHETRFLRHEATQELICRKLLPQSPAQCKKLPLSFNVWSVGCASGEEPYSIAMAIDEHMERVGCGYYLGVMASDISRGALTAGRTGIYSAQQMKYVPPHWVQKYFTPVTDAHHEGKYQINSELRQRVCFNQANVLDLGKMPIGYMDVIVCQNLLIYYDQPQRIKIANTLVEYLAPKGVLILAVGELINWSHPDMERFAFANTLAYRRK